MLLPSGLKPPPRCPQVSVSCSGTYVKQEAPVDSSEASLKRRQAVGERAINRVRARRQAPEGHCSWALVAEREQNSVAGAAGSLEGALVYFTSSTSILGTTLTASHGPGTHRTVQQGPCTWGRRDVAHPVLTLHACRGKPRWGTGLEVWRGGGGSQPQRSSQAPGSQSSAASSLFLIVKVHHRGYVTIRNLLHVTSPPSPPGTRGCLRILGRVTAQC